MPLKEEVTSASHDVVTIVDKVYGKRLFRCTPRLEISYHELINFNQGQVSTARCLEHLVELRGFGGCCGFIRKGDA